LDAKQFVPAQVAGDGNCLFRSISLSLYGTEDFHVQLPLLATIEVPLDQGLYDGAGDNYCLLYKEDDGVWVSDYHTLITDIVLDKSLSGMLVVPALSSVVHKPIQMRWLITGGDSWYVPLTKLVIGRNVTTVSAANVLWTIGTVTYPGKDSVDALQFDHFVPLMTKTVVPCADLRDGGDQDGPSVEVADDYDIEPLNDADADGADVSRLCLLSSHLTCAVVFCHSHTASNTSAVMTLQ